MDGKNFLKKIFQIIIVLLGISFLTFALIYLSPGDPAEIMLTACGNIPTPELVAQTRIELGIDKPFLTQYRDWLLKICRGDMGYSYSLKVPVWRKLISNFFITLKLAVTSLFLMVIISIPLGVLAAINRNKKIDYFVRGFTFIGISVPSFWLGLIFLSVFGVKLKLVPIAGGTANLKALILPAITLALSMSAKYTRQVRTTVLDELRQDYVTGARIRGMSEKIIMIKHVLPNVLLPLVTLLGLSLGSLLSGTAIVEIVYNWPGMGSMAVKAISTHDYPLVQGYVLFIALFYMVINLIVDSSYKYLDPRLEEKR